MPAMTTIIAVQRARPRLPSPVSRLFLPDLSSLFSQFLQAQQAKRINIHISTIDSKAVIGFNLGMITPVDHKKFTVDALQKTLPGKMSHE
jgi:hypothetical protein